jgi:stearoyl-CoA desaturase (delta-9 desaturase)
MLNFLKTNEYRIFLSIIYILSFYGIYKLFVDVSLWWLLIAAVWSKFIQLFGHSIGMHRYFAHKNFNTTPAKEKFLAWISVFLGVGSPIQYARNHRQHHRVADQLIDYHSPVNDGKFYTMLGIWEFNNLQWFIEHGGITPRDLLINSTYRFIHDNYYKMWYVAIIITALVDIRITIYVLALPSLLTHIDFNVLTNYVGHAWGYRNFDTPDQSKNNKWVHLISPGEGFHNNHHAHPYLYDFAVKKNEIDSTAQLIEKLFAVDGPQTQRGKLRID